MLRKTGRGAPPHTGADIVAFARPAGSKQAGARPLTAEPLDVLWWWHFETKQEIDALNRRHKALLAALPEAERAPAEAWKRADVTALSNEIVDLYELSEEYVRAIEYAVASTPADYAIKLLTTFSNAHGDAIAWDPTHRAALSLLRDLLPYLPADIAPIAARLVEATGTDNLHEIIYGRPPDEPGVA